MKKSKYLIIYHKEDADGLVSAAIIYNYILYKLYNGNISLLLKISLVIGFILCKVLEKTVKFKKHK